MYYHAKVFTSTATGQRLKNVTCEKCAAAFHYQLARQGTGRASAPYYLFQGWAKHRAEKYAQKNLQKRLNLDQELVPCPNCHWVNESALRAYRKTKHTQWFVLAVVLALLAAVIDLILYFNAEHIANHNPSLTAPEFLITTAIGIATVAACLAIQFLLRSRINPNKNLIDGLPSVPPGTPPALTRNPNGQLSRAPGDISKPTTDPTWALFRPGQLRWEPYCCQCLDPATTVYNLPMTPGAVTQVPLCQPCRKKLRLHFWLRNLATLPLSALLAWFISKLPPHIDEGGRIAMLILLGLFFWAVAFFIVNHSLQPYRIRNVDKERAIFKIGFKNPAYTALLIRKIGQADGLF